jgi:hypothetical protein
MSNESGSYVPAWTRSSIRLSRSADSGRPSITECGGGVPGGVPGLEGAPPSE